MNWRNLIISTPLTVTPGRGDAVAAETPPAQSTSPFLTPQSVASFPVASGIVYAISQGIAKLPVPAHVSPFIPLVVALLVGAIIYAITFDDKRVPRPSSPREWAISVGIALLNSLLLWTSAIGISTVTNTAPGH